MNLWNKKKFKKRIFEQSSEDISCSDKKCSTHAEDKISPSTQI